MQTRLPFFSVGSVICIEKRLAKIEKGEYFFWSENGKVSSAVNRAPWGAMSKEARERIAAAQRKRWAAQKKAKASSMPGLHLGITAIPTCNAELSRHTLSADDLAKGLLNRFQLRRKRS
jgi:hypothetical protein